jgi:hypothetical protein
MNQRLAKALSVAALGIAATGLFLPRAAADSVTHLAPGVDCEGFECTNNTNDTYRIEFDATCLYSGTVLPTRDDIADEARITPHQHEIINPSCPWQLDHKSNEVQGVPVEVYYKSAQVDNRPPAGSAH